MRAGAARHIADPAHARHELLPGPGGGSRRRLLAAAESLASELKDAIGDGVLLHQAYPRTAPRDGRTVGRRWLLTPSAVFNLAGVPVTEVPLWTHAPRPADRRGRWRLRQGMTISRLQWRFELEACSEVGSPPERCDDREMNRTLGATGIPTTAIALGLAALGRPGY